MKNEVRLKQTEKEKLVNAKLGNSDYKNFNMQENSIDSLINKENARKFNEQIEEYNEQLENNNNEVKEGQSLISYNIESAEIRPMFSRILVKPFKQNPFQKLKIEGGLITDLGGYTPHAQINPNTGKYEEQKEFIVTGCVVEVGPDTKYLKEGDVIYYRIDTSVPVPFFKQGLISLNENQVIAVVNENLTKRFNQINSK